MSIFQLLLIVLLYFDWNIRQSFDALMEGCCHFCGWCCCCCFCCCRWCWRCHRICDHSCFLIACLICVSLNRLAYWDSLLASFLPFSGSVHYSISQELHRHTETLTHSLNWTEPYGDCFVPFTVYQACSCVFVFYAFVCICVYPCVSVYNNRSCRFSIFNTILQLGQQHRSQRSK